MTSKVLLVLPPQRVASRAKAKGEDAIASTRATHRALEEASHQLTLSMPA